MKSYVKELVGIILVFLTLTVWVILWSHTYGPGVVLFEDKEGEPHSVRVIWMRDLNFEGWDAKLEDGSVVVISGPFQYIAQASPTLRSEGVVTDVR